MTASSPCTLERHLSEVRELLAPTVARLMEQSEELPLSDPGLPGRVVARAHAARTPVPAFDNSQMDGFAVCSADLEGASPERPVELRLGWATAAGDRPLVHLPGTASPIMTGAAMPSGADAVVPIEQALPDEFPAFSRLGEPEPLGSASFTAPVPSGRFVRFRAESLAAGDEIAQAGMRVTPTLIGALAAAGLDRATVLTRPRVLLCSTGDELAEPGETLQPGRIHDANTPMLRAALAGLGAVVEVLRTGDTAERLREALAASIGSADLVVTSGGISKGAFEVVREALLPLGVGFHPVAMQPGGPQGLGVLDAGGRGVPVLCFPGNPVSAVLSCELFLAPELRRLARLSPQRETLRLPLAHDVSSPAAKHQIRRAALDDEGRVVVFPPGSHLIGNLAAAELLVHLPVGVEHAPAGSLIDAWRFND